MFLFTIVGPLPDVFVLLTPRYLKMSSICDAPMDTRNVSDSKTSVQLNYKIHIYWIFIMKEVLF